MAKNYYDITLALAGICQSARLVQQLAHQGHCDADALHVSLNSIIDMNPSSTLAVFGGSEANLRVGLETLLGVLNASSRQGLNAELTRYTLSLMVLERKLSSAKGALDTLGNRINGLQRQLEHFDLQSETLMSAMAAIYVDVISPLGPRIQVTGSPAVLQSPQDFCGWQLYERGELVDVLWGELEWSSPTDDDELPEVTGPAWIVDNVTHYGG